MRLRSATRLVRQFLWTLGGIFDEDGGRIQRLVFRRLQILSSPLKVSKRNADATTACGLPTTGSSTQFKLSFHGDATLAKRGVARKHAKYNQEGVRRAVQMVG